MKAAYDRALRKKLIEALRERLSPELVEMIAATLAAATEITVGDDTESENQLLAGVPQGSQLRWALFNIYMDVLAESRKETSASMRKWPANLFADDVELMAKSRREMKHLLEICDKWAVEFGLVLSAEKCVILGKRKGAPVQLHGRTLRKAKKCKYLGMVASPQGIHDDLLEKMIQTACLRLGELKSIRFKENGAGMGLGVRLFKTFLLSLWEFAAHITPSKPMYSVAIVAFEKRYWVP